MAKQGSQSGPSFIALRCAEICEQSARIAFSISLKDCCAAPSVRLRSHFLHANNGSPHFRLKQGMLRSHLCPDVELLSLYTVSQAAGPKAGENRSGPPNADIIAKPRIAHAARHTTTTIQTSFTENDRIGGLSGFPSKPRESNGRCPILRGAGKRPIGNAHKVA